MSLAGGPAAAAAGPAPPLPKAELHCHAEGTAEPSLALRQAARYGVDLADVVRDGTYVWDGFSGFLRSYDRVAALFRTAEDYRRLARDHLCRLAGAGTLYAELFVSPDHAAMAGLEPRRYLAGLADGADAAEADTGIVSRFVVIAVRHLGPDAAEAAARFASRPGQPRVTGFGLAGDERAFAPKDFAKAFATAADAGLGLTAHAGEFAGPAAIRQTLDTLRVSRLGHGVRAIEDGGLVDRLAREGTVLEVCPGSNLALGLYPGMDAHPLRRLFEAGVRVTLNSDDPPFFGTSLAREYDLARGQGFSEAELAGLTRNALEAAFVDEATRAALLERLPPAAISLGAPGASG